MWCKECNKETEALTCPYCGAVTEKDIPYEVYWCSDCKTPIIRAANDSSPQTCPLCGKPIEYLAADVRPVFPEERL